MHIDTLISRSNRLLGFIYRTTRLFTNIRCIIILFVTMVRPIMEYCSVVWTPSYAVHIERIERVQKRFVRALCYRCGFDPYSNRHDHWLTYFSLPRLAKRRSYRDLMFMFKTLNNYIKCQSLRELIILHVPSCHFLRRNPLLYIDYHRTNYGLHSRLTRLSNLVNSTGNIDILSGNLTSFCAALRRSLYN